jgi:hypothetical protein
MTQYVPISKAQHQSFGFQLEKPFLFAQNWPFIPLSAQEISQVMGIFPVLFQKQNDAFQLGIATGFGQDNCLIHPQNGKFLLPYVPAILRRYPFNLLKSEAGQNVLCVMDGEAGFAQDSGDAVLSETGELTDKGQNLIGFLENLNRSFAKDAEVVQLIDDLGLLAALPFQFKDESSGDLKILRNDLYRVDEVKLNQLSADALEQLMKVGAFPMIYGHLFSMQKLSQVNAVVDGYNQLTQQVNARAENLEKMFSDDESDLLKF